MLMGKIKRMRSKLKCERENRGLRWKMKGSRAKEENEKVKGEKKSADSAKGEVDKM